MNGHGDIAYGTALQTDVLYNTVAPVPQFCIIMEYVYAHIPNHNMRVQQHKSNYL